MIKSNSLSIIYIERFSLLKQAQEMITPMLLLCDLSVL